MKIKYYADIYTGDHDYLMTKEYGTIEECVNVVKGFKAIMSQVSKFIDENTMDDSEWTGNDFEGAKLKCSYYDDGNWGECELATIATIKDDYSLEYCKKEIIAQYKENDDEMLFMAKFKTKEELEQWVEINKERYTLIEWKETY